MFLQKLLEDNRPLAQVAFQWQQDGTILPDTYLLDLDQIRQNGRVMMESGKKNGVQLYFMLKQLGRNPLVAKALMEEGFAGAVCVDYREALTMVENGIPLGNVGHLVQVPQALVRRIVAARPQVITVYSLEKAQQIGAAAQELGLVQPIQLRVLGRGDMLYSGQYGGFALETLGETVTALEAVQGVRIAGVCSFPCFLFDEKANDILPTPNMETVQQAAQLLRARGYTGLQLNMPSATCTHSIPMIAAAGGTHGEPGHGLTGTTPYHAEHPEAAEKTAYVYVSEISHAVGDSSFCFGGGHYRRGHLQNALVGTCLEDAALVPAVPPTDESIDYHFELKNRCKVGECALMCFRTQMFVTRSEIAVVEGLHSAKPRLAGIYDVNGRRLRG